MIKKWLRSICPPLIWTALSRFKNPSILYLGNFKNWDDASRFTSGYDDNIILKKVDNASFQVVSGHASFERDGIVFKKPEYPFYILFPMALAALRNNNQLSILDYGGSLGSSYWLCRPLLTELQTINWTIVEQKHYVSLGREKYENQELKFYEEIKQIPDEELPKIALLSSVIQYIKDPECVLNQIKGLASINDILIDRTPFCQNLNHRILIQKIPTSIYKASYPLWIFSYEKFLKMFDDQWELVENKLSPEGVIKTQSGEIFEYRYLWFRRKKCSLN